jgi:choline dehydrogenase-like flavoprotein
MAFIDARTLPDASRIEADLVIIGGGLAGITLAKELAGGPLKVAILESGGREIDMEIQALYAGTAVVKAPDNPDKPLDDYPVQSRARVLGGSGMIWGGKCVPLDPADFAARPWAPHSGWPVTASSFSRSTTGLATCWRFRASTPTTRPPEGPGPPAAGAGSADGFFSAPRVFSRYSGGADKAAFDRFRTDFADAPNITVYLHANVTQIRLSAKGDGSRGWTWPAWTASATRRWARPMCWRSAASRTCGCCWPRTACGPRGSATATTWSAASSRAT